MKNTTKKIFALPLLAVAFLPALTNAANVDLNMNVGVGIGGERGRPDGNMQRGRPDGDMPRTGSSTKDWNSGTSTRPMGGKSVGGVITAVNATSFTIDYPTKNGTTTITVNADANTTFRSGTSTIALANLTVGQRVSVAGEYATSTNSISAKQVMVINTQHMNNRDGNKPQGFFGKIIGWFKKLF